MVKWQLLQIKFVNFARRSNRNSIYVVSVVIPENGINLKALRKKGFYSTRHFDGLFPKKK